MSKSRFGSWALGLTLVAFSGLGGCASLLDPHHAMRGTVAMKVGDREAHVCLGDGEVDVGDRVAIFVNRCKRGPEAPFGDVSAPPCTKVHIGGGEVVETLNEHYSVVRFDPGVPFEEGTVVELP